MRGRAAEGAGGAFARLVGGSVLVVASLLLAGCSSDGSSDEDVSTAEDPSTTAEPTTTEADGASSGLETTCDLLPTEEVQTVTGVAPLELRDEPSPTSGPPYGRCAWEQADGPNVVYAAATRALTDQPSPQAWWNGTLAVIEDEVDEIRPLPEFGEYGYLVVEGTDVDVIWFPEDDVYVEARLTGAGFATPPAAAELEQIAIDLSASFNEALEPHLPLPEPEDG